MSRVGVALALLAIAALPGCGGRDSGLIIRTAPFHARLGANGRLNADPAPLTVGQLERVRSRDPRSTVMRFLFWTQWGNFAGLLDLYDPETRAALGRHRLRHAYADSRPQLLFSKLRIGLTCRRGDAAFVAATLLSRNLDPRPEYFVLERFRAGWRIVLETALGIRQPMLAGPPALLAAQRAVDLGRSKGASTRPLRACRDIDAAMRPIAG